MTPESVDSFLFLAIGFAVAGVVVHGYQVMAKRPLVFAALHQEARSAALASVPLLAFAAPFIIMRGLLRGDRSEPRNAGFVALGTIFAGFWSLMSGAVVAAGWVELVRLMA